MVLSSSEEPEASSSAVLQVAEWKQEQEEVEVEVEVVEAHLMLRTLDQVEAEVEALDLKAEGVEIC